MVIPLLICLVTIPMVFCRPESEPRIYHTGHLSLPADYAFDLSPSPDAQPLIYHTSKIPQIPNPFNVRPPRPPVSNRLGGVPMLRNFGELDLPVDYTVDLSPPRRPMSNLLGTIPQPRSNRLGGIPLPMSNRLGTIPEPLNLGPDSLPHHTGRIPLRPLPVDNTVDLVPEILPHQTGRLPQPAGLKIYGGPDEGHPVPGLTCEQGCMAAFLYSPVCAVIGGKEDMFPSSEVAECTARCRGQAITSTRAGECPQYIMVD